MQKNKIVVSDFRHGENIQSDGEVFPPLILRHFFTNSISKKRHMKYNTDRFITSLLLHMQQEILKRKKIIKSDRKGRTPMTSHRRLPTVLGLRYTSFKNHGLLY